MSEHIRMREHTPGPWRINGAGDLFSEDEQVAKFEDIPDVADARLIAAAPELLEAADELSSLLALHEGHEGYSLCDYCVALQVLRAAIAKAEGRERA